MNTIHVINKEIKEEEENRRKTRSRRLHLILLFSMLFAGYGLTLPPLFPSTQQAKPGFLHSHVIDFPNPCKPPQRAAAQTPLVTTNTNVNSRPGKLLGFTVIASLKNGGLGSSIFCMLSCSMSTPFLDHKRQRCAMRNIQLLE